MQHSKRPLICLHQAAQKCLAKPVMLAPSPVDYLEKIQNSANVDLKLLIAYSQQMLFFMQGSIHQDIKERLREPLGPENVSRYQLIIDDVCEEVLFTLAQKSGVVDIVCDIEEPLFVGLVQRVFGYAPVCVRSFLRDVDVSVKIVEPVQSVKTLLKIQAVLRNMITSIIEQLKNPRKSGLMYDIHSKLMGENRSYSLDQIAATIAILLIASRTSSETISHIVIKNDSLSKPLRSKFSDKKWVAAYFQTLVRFCVSTEYLTRVASADVVIDDIELKKNDSLFIHVPSVNRDKSHFRNCEYEQIANFPPERHLAFGAGVHRCPGSELARQLIVTFISGLFRRFPDVRVEQHSVIFKSSLLAKRIASASVLLGDEEQGNKQ